jgi:acylphosphatase
MPAIHLSIVGRVQGVGFRWFVRVAARRLGLSGWVRNREDGTVELAASGPEEKLAEFRRQVSKGPDGAHVMDVLDLGEVLEELEFPFGMRR